MKALAESFKATFNELEDHLQRLTGLGYRAKFIDALDAACESSAPVSKYRYDLERFNKIRNVLVHQVMTKHYAAFPHPEELAGLQRVCGDILHPRLVSDIMSNPARVSVLAPISTVITCMTEHKYSQIPLVNESGTLQGLLTEGTVCRWLARSLPELIEDGSTPAGEALRIGEGGTYIDVLKSDTVAEVTRLFGLETGKEPVSVALVRDNGRVEGIVTAWDLLDESTTERYSLSDPACFAGPDTYQSGTKVSHDRR